MTEVHAAPEAPRPSPAPEQDLSDEIIRAVERNPGDDVRCTFVSNGNYRCNWWALQATTGYDNPSMDGLFVTTHRVRMSRFLRATKVGQRLVIEDVTSRRPGGGRDMSASREEEHVITK